jgi:hypothetical protein
MYSSVRTGVKPLGLALVIAGATLAGAPVANEIPDARCDEGLTKLWTPLRPQLGRYEVCTSPQPLSALAGPGWLVETLPPLDALGGAGPYRRPAVARVYGGRQPAVARGWVERDGRVVSITLISPYPNRDLTALEPGTLIIRYHVHE